jgi:sugar/nucleoside kinase (ribokinase family)
MRNRRPTYDLLAIGNLTLDMIHEVDRIPNLDETGLVFHSNVCFGGRAGNIALTGALLDLDVAVASIVGDDFVASGYKDYLLRHKVNIDRVKIFNTKKSAGIHVYRRRDRKHIYFFQPNAIKHSKSLDLEREDVLRFRVIYLTSLNSGSLITSLMTKIEQLSGVFFGFGEEIYRKSKSFLKSAIKISSYVNLNAAEFEILRTKLKISSIAEMFHIGDKLEFLSVSLGEKGSVIYIPNSKYFIPAVPPDKFVSSLGAGDAYVAGLIYGIVNRWSTKDSGRLGSVLSSFILESEGAQNAFLKWDTIRDRYEQFFGELPRDQEQ